MHDEVRMARSDELREHLSAVRRSIEDACRRSGRDPESVTLVAVSKTKPDEDILDLYEAGQRDFGENYVQELRGKRERLPKDIRWHMIGHLQRNKVKYIAEYIYMIHSVDSAELALTIEKEAAKHDRVIPVLVEVNIAEEKTKYGLMDKDVHELVSLIRTLPHLEFRGFMTSAPFTDNAEEVRPVFRRLRQLTVDMNSENDNNETVGECSMGMSGDYEVAVEEGSSYVRVGTSIFGARSYAGAGL
ncbi:MAG: YggS family pyridoxal phosphate-dependent enzyme [Lachnospiraceae bacterium]|nr:YggS family pyridoxal phosphate-dependent enzyme [Lachnospiraceae bacterium]